MFKDEPKPLASAVAGVPGGDSGMPRASAPTPVSTPTAPGTPTLPTEPAPAPMFGVAAQGQKSKKGASSSFLGMPAPPVPANASQLGLKTLLGQ